MKNKAIAMLLVLLLCLSLCACGSYRNSYGTDTMDRNGTNENSIDMTPDIGDGMVRDNNANDGVVDGSLAVPSPNVTRNP